MKRAVRAGIFLIGALAARRYLQRGHLSDNDLADVVAQAAQLFPLVYMPYRVVRSVWRKPDHLERVMFRFSTGDVFTRGDCCRSILILGAIGTGKTSSSGKTVARALLSSGAGIIIFASKPEDRADWEKLVRKAGREADWRLFSPDSELKTNLLTEYVKAGLPAFAVVDELIGVSKVAIKSKEGGDGAVFWEQSQNAMLNHSIEPLRLAYGTAKAADIRRFIANAPRSVRCLRREQDGEPSPEFLAYHRGFHAQVMALAAQAKKTSIEEHDFRQCLMYWNAQYANEDPKTRSNIEAGVLGLLDIFLRGVVHDKLATETSISAADLEEGAIWFVDFSPSRLGAVGKFVSAALKRHVQDHCLRRVIRPGDRLIALFSDESQGILDPKDAHFIDQARSHRSLLVYLTQSISNFKMVLGEENANALMGQFGTLIAHPVDIMTSKYLSERAGNALQLDFSGNMAPAPSLAGQIMGVADWNGGVNQHMRPLIESAAFQSGRTGGRRNRLRTDSYVFRIGNPFSNGLNVIQAEWSQK